MEKKSKTITANLPKSEFIRTYLLLFNGKIQLTPAELNVMEGFIELYLQLKADKISDENISILLFNPLNRKKVREKFNISENSFNNTVSSLKKKGILVPDELGGYVIHHYLIPETEVIFKFNIL